MLEEAWKTLPTYDIKIIMGDANAKIGKEDIWISVAGKESLHEVSNDNGTRLLSLAVAGDLKVKSTAFPRKNIHKATWISPNGEIENQIDHVLIDKRHHKNITNVRSIRKAECGSDHRLVLVNIDQTIKRIIKKQHKSGSVFAVDKLKDNLIATEFRINLENRFQALGAIDDVEEEAEPEGKIEKEWDRLKQAIKKSAEEVCGQRKKKSGKPWFDEECREAVEKRKETKERWLNNKKQDTKERYKNQAKETVRLLRKKKREWINKLLEKAEEDRTANNARDFYRSIRFFKKTYTPDSIGIKDQAGNIIMEQDKCLKRWREYFFDLLNGELMENDEENEIYMSVQPRIPNPQVGEVIEAIKELKNNKAPGEDGISAEILKAGGLCLAHQIHKLITKIWEQEITPKEWQDAIVIPIHKKGDKTDCNNFRGISLLNVTYKILSKIILKRLEEYSNTIIGEHQTGFVKGR